MTKGLLLIAAAILATTFTPASAQDSMWKTFYEDGMKAWSSGNFVEGEKLLSSALKAADESLEANDPRKAIIIENLGFCLVQQQKYSEAEAVYKKELAILEKLHGAESPTVVNVLTSLAGVYSNQRKFVESESLFKRALAMNEKAGKDTEQVALVLEKMGNMYARQEKYAEADAAYLRAQSIYEKTAGPFDPKLVPLLIFRSSILSDSLKYGESEKVLKRALEISEKKIGAESRQTAMCLDALSALYLVQGKYAEALPLSKRALALNEKLNGADSIFCLVSIESLALANIGLGNLTEGEALNKRVIALVEKTYGPQHPFIVTGIKALARISMQKKNLAQAQLHLEKALKLQESASGISPAELASTMNSLADVYAEQDNFVDAEAMYRKVLAKDQERLGDTSPVVASDLDNLAKVLSAQGKADEAAKLGRQALTIKKTLPGSEKLMQESKQPPKQVKITAPTADPNRPVKDKWALVVGISDFQDPSLNLQYAAKDATDFANFLVKEANFQQDHVKLLTNEQATRDNIVGALGDKWLGRLANRDDLVVVYVSSHGSAPASEAKDTNFIVAYETNFNNLILTGIPMQWLTAGISKMVHCDRTVLVLDVCHAGAAKATEKGLARTGEAAFSVDNVMLGKGQVLIASSDADQTSYESKNYKNGVFTYRLLEGLRRQGDKTPLTEACNYLREKVEEEVLRDRAKLQTPVLVKNWEGEDVILGVKPTSPRAGLAEASSSKAPQVPGKEAQTAASH